MKEEELISIIVPVYKVEKYIHKCINSIIDQTYKNLQIILVDDGSPDNCGKICDEYALKDNRIEVIHKANTGLSDARNVGINKANGQYIGFVDSDDYIDKTMYEDMYKLIKERNADICICNLYNVIENEDIKTMKNIDNGVEEYNKTEILKEVLLDKKIQSYAWNKLYKRSLFNDIKFPVGRKYEDIGTTFYILEKCEKIVVTGKPEYYYLNRKDSIVNNVEEQTIIDYVDIINERYDYIESKYKQLNKCNIYFLARTLITAYNDINKLNVVSKKLKDKVDNLYEKVKRDIKEDERKIDDLLDQNQKVKLKQIINKQM